MGSKYWAAPQPLSSSAHEDPHNGPLGADIKPLRTLLLTASGWVNRHQQQVIEYLVEEIREFTAHNHLELIHQGIGNELIEGTASGGVGAMRRNERLGGRLSYYDRAA